MATDKSKKKRIAIIDKTLCNPEKCGYVCIKVCPMNKMKKECIVINEKSKNKFPVINEEICIGCGICVKKCPMNAIKIINLSAELETPLHQYGANGFRIYGIALPKEGPTVFIGKNGIGKTTMVKILSGRIIPNHGSTDMPQNWEESIKNMPIEAKEYFKKIKNKEINVSVKPQRIDTLASYGKTVKELMKEIGNLNEKQIENAAIMFGIQYILNRRVRDLSGGELQKVAIAIASERDSDMIYYDEFTNYLDIGERLNIGTKIKDISEEKNVITVDHDLAVLDYIGEYVYVFYGEENAYGVVSNVRGIRNGINEYIEGYLSTENVRFRDYEISFAYHTEEDNKKRDAVIEYPDLQKTYEEFELKVNGGRITKSTITGIVGKNALGKTTFIKILAGIETADNGFKLEGIRIAYKPQYLLKYMSVNKTVSEFLSGAELKEELKEIVKRMGISRLMNKHIGALSGGELQAVVLAKTLSKDADIYLLDEPSAFMDVEQRLTFAHVLRQMIEKNEKSAIVIDHDILFIDAVSNNIIVFNGTPSKSGEASAPEKRSLGMNTFLKTIGITIRRDKDTKRPRINKKGSLLDREQREKGMFYI